MNNRTTSLFTDYWSDIFVSRKWASTINTHTRDSEDTGCVYFTQSLIVHHNWNQLTISLFYKLTIDQSKSAQMVNVESTLFDQLSQQVILFAH